MKYGVFSSAPAPRNAASVPASIAFASGVSVLDASATPDCR